MLEGPIEVFLRFGLESRIVKQVCKGNEAVKEIRAPLPGFAFSALPAAIGADIPPGLFEVSAQSSSLDGELLLQPSLGANGT
jgi:hypothetical protein